LILGQTNLHSVGQTFWPGAQTFGLNQLTQYADYTWDSVSFGYNYAYNKPGTVDTLRVSFYRATRMREAPFENSEVRTCFTDFNTETLRGPANATVDVLLNEEDSLWRRSSFPFAAITVPVPAAAQSLHSTTELNGVETVPFVAFTITYIPGYDYSLGDTLQHDYEGGEPVNKLNHFKVIKFRDLAKSSSDLGDYYNNSLNVFRAQLYELRDEDGNLISGWTGFYSPGNSPFDYNEVLFSSFYINSQNVGLEELGDNGKYTVYPNPVQSGDQLNVSLELEKNSNLEIVLYNLLGSRVKTLANRTYAPGEYVESYDLSGVKPGLYFVTISNGKDNFTKKITVN